MVNGVQILKQPQRIDNVSSHRNNGTRILIIDLIVKSILLRPLTAYNCLLGQ